MNDWLLLVLGSLATYRLTILLSLELGPFWIFKRWRQWVKRKAPKKTHLDDGVECPMCTSVWVSALITALLWWLDLIAPAHGWLWWLSFSGMAILLHHQFTADWKK